MKERARFILVTTITLGAAVVFAATAAKGLFYAGDTEMSVPAVLEERAPSAHVPPTEKPARLLIPRIEVDASVEEVGVAASGNMAVPKKYADVGWYKYGPIPGQQGSAVLAGHVDNGFALAGVFKRLEEVRAGDDIYIETAGEEHVHFVVEEVHAYPHDQVPVEVLFNRADMPRLNLITCGGTWLPSEKTYDERLVVYARLVP